MKGQKVDEETDSARPFEGKWEFHLLQMKTPIVSKPLRITIRLHTLHGFFFPNSFLILRTLLPSY